MVRGQDITSHRGRTVLPVKWTTVRTERGHRYIEGIAYNAAINGERRRATCSDKTWFDPDDDVFYWDEAVRWTVDELSKLDLTGKPIRMMHADEDELPAVGSILHNFMDNSGHLHIVAEISGDDKYGQAAISLVDNGTCHELSIGYPLDRDPVTKVVYHSDVDEVSLVDKAHFRGCRVSVKANKSNGAPKSTSAPYTTYRAVRASAKALSTTTPSASMSTNTADKPSLESQLDADLPEGVAPPDLVRNMAIIKKRLIEAEAKLAEVAVREKADEDAKKKAREDYAILHGPRAEEITAHMKEIAKEIGGVAALSKEWEEMNKQILTLPDPLSQEMQSVQVSASNGFRKLKAELAARDARIAELEAGALEAAAMAHIDPGEDERLERRELKARGRTAAGGGGMMTPAQGVSERDIPDWAREFNQRAGVGNAYVPPSQRETRGVTARMSTPAPAQAPATRPIPQKRQPQQQQQQPKQQQQQQQPPQRSVPWAHRTKNSMRNDHESGEFWGFLADVTPNTDFAKGAMAPLQGMSIVPRQEGSHY